MYAKTRNPNSRTTRAAEAAMNAAKQQAKEAPTAPVQPKLPKPMPSDSPKKGDIAMVRMKGYNSPIHNPDQNRWIMDDVDGVQIVMDNWTLSQIKAGLVEVVPK